MKKFALYICMSLGALFTACEDDYTNEGVFDLSQTEFTNLSHEGEDLSIDLTAYDGWTASCPADWVKLSATEGRGKSTLHVKVRATSKETVLVPSNCVPRTLHARSTSARKHFPPVKNCTISYPL